MGKVFTITEGLENMGALRNGGQGSVYKARRTGQIIVAVKLLPTPIHTENEDDKHYRDFINEVEKLKKVNEKPTPHVVKILSSGLTESGSLPFIEMEFIEGPDLGELLKPPHDPVFTIPEVIKVANQLAGALSHCHQVGVNHGDVKSNNVKFNIHTGNYMLLDFGLAIMTNEQRRDSLRNAGAVEFMAPEQNEGIMLPQTDVYSYGIILYELLAGVVPFPLNSNAQTARNNVMVAHMEAPVPNLLELRRQNLPSSWTTEQQDREMQVPQWLLTIIDRCLQKEPTRRYANGTELHQAILSQNSALTIKNNAEEVLILQNQTQSLQTSLHREQERTTRYEQEIAQLKQALAQKEQAVAAAVPATASGTPPAKGLSTAAVLVIAFLMIGVGAWAGHAFFPKTADNTSAITTKPVTAGTTKFTASARKKRHARKKPITTAVVKAEADSHLVGAAPQGTVQPPADNSKGKDAGKTFTLFNTYAYFHDSPDAASVRKANINRWNNARLTAIDDINGYIYVIYKNDQGQVSKGWLDKRDLIRVN
jgi:serine/threonine protein kinase